MRLKGAPFIRFNTGRAEEAGRQNTVGVGIESSKERSERHG